MGRMHESYKVTWVQSYTGDNDKDGTMNRAAIDMVHPVQMSIEDRKQAVNTDKRSSAHAWSTSDCTMKDVDEGKNDKEVEDQVVNNIWLHVQKPESRLNVNDYYRCGPQGDTVKPAAYICQTFIDQDWKG